MVEALQKPAVVVLTSEFVGIASQVAELEGHPSLRQVVLPYPLEGRAADDVRSIAQEAYPTLLTTLGVRH